MPDRPYTLLSCSVSLDGYLGDQTPRLALSNEADFDRVDEVRAASDAILVGARTVRRDNPRLLVRSPARRAARTARGLPATPIKVTVSERVDLDAHSDFFTTGETDKLVYTSTGRVRDARARLGPAATIVDGGRRVRMRRLGEDLADRGVGRLMVEGGGVVHTQFLADDLVDELQLVVAPFFVGDSRAPRFVSDGRFPWNAGRRATLAEVRQIGDVVLLRYALSTRFEGRMRTRWAVRAVPAIGLVAQLLLLAVLAATTGLGEAGWRVGVACALIMATALGRGLARSRAVRLGAASWATLARATLAVGVAALVADSFTRDTPVALLVTLAAVALVLDAVDGPLARRTGTETALGARFDGEVDAFLILALSVYAAPAYGTWVLAIGAARYVFLAGEWLLPWMRAPLPPRRWRRVVAALQGIVLTVAAAGILPVTLTQALLAAALTALAASMGECAWWLWRRRDRAGERGPLPTDIAVGLSALALALVWAALVSPDRLGQFTPGAFARLPVELLVVVAVAVLLPPVPRRGLAAAAGVVLSALVLVKILDVGFFLAFDRRFDPVDDSGYLGTGIDTLRIGVGAAKAYLAVAGIAVVVVALLAIPALALWRVTRVAAGHRRWALGAVAALGLLWVALRLAGAPVADSGATALALHEVQAVQAGLGDRAKFAPQIAHDRFARVPGKRLLTGLRGKDVLVVFVESYGQVAVEGSTFSPGVDALLERGTAQLRAAGFASRSAFLTSPTFGGLSWLAHATLQSGLQVNGQRRYAQLVHSKRLTLTTAFRRAGWRAVGVMPANRQNWPEGSSFYHYEKLYSRDDLGYRGKRLGLYRTPDQYVFYALQNHELAKPHHRPVFAEIDTITSHFPWEQVPRILPWNELGDGTIFDRIPALEFPRPGLFADAATAKVAYGRSIQYAMGSLISFVRHYRDKNLVLILLGDHQPATFVSGQDATHDVPVSIIAHDPKVMDQIVGWDWQDGLLPGAQAPVTPMSSFRDRFLTAFGPK